MVKKILIVIAIIILGVFIWLEQVGDKYMKENNLTDHVPGDYRALFKRNYVVLPSLNYHRASNTDISHFVVRDTAYVTHHFNVVVYRLADNIDSFTIEVDKDVPDDRDFENDDNYAEVIQNYLYRYLKDPRYVKNKIILSVNADSSSLVTQRRNYAAYYIKMRELALFYNARNSLPEVYLRATERFEDYVIPVNLALFIKNRRLYLVILSITFEGQLLRGDYLDKLLNV